MQVLDLKILCVFRLGSPLLQPRRAWSSPAHRSLDARSAPRGRLAKPLNVRLL